MRFNIEKFLQENNILYKTKGSNVAKGNVNINCPFCDHDDKYFMGINTSKLLYGCWWDASHRGRNIVNLISKLLNCSYKYAYFLINGHQQITIDDKIDFTTSIKQKLFKTIHTTHNQIESLKEANLSEFDTFKDVFINSVHYRYLESRGFNNVSLLVDKYNLKFAQVGEWIGRIIFPIYLNNQLMTWQGRDITDKSYLRYKDLSKDKSKKYVKSCIYNYDNLQGDILYICEGVFDALKIDYYTPSYITATCIFTKTVTKEQYKLLRIKVKEFKEIRILLDQNTIKQAHQIKGELLPFNKNTHIIYLLNGVKDAGELTQKQINDCIR